MVKFIKCTDLDGNIKEYEHLNKCPYGEWMFGSGYLREGIPILFIYNDDSGKMLKSSFITDVHVSKKEEVTRYKITTRNSIYYFIEYELEDNLDGKI